MNNEIRVIEPNSLWNNFTDLNSVPRPSKKEEKVIFSDIRNVDKILDYMITDLDNIPLNRYEIIEQKGNSILYWPTLKSFLRILDKPIIFVAKEAESILLRFDGNVVYIRSRWSAINKLKKQLKLLELV